MYNSPGILHRCVGALKRLFPRCIVSCGECANSHCFNSCCVAGIKVSFPPVSCTVEAGPKKTLFPQCTVLRSRNRDSPNIRFVVVIDTSRITTPVLCVADSTDTHNLLLVVGNSRRFTICFVWFRDQTNPWSFVSPITISYLNIVRICVLSTRTKVLGARGSSFASFLNGSLRKWILKVLTNHRNRIIAVLRSVQYYRILFSSLIYRYNQLKKDFKNVLFREFNHRQ